MFCGCSAGSSAPVCYLLSAIWYLARPHPPRRKRCGLGAENSLTWKHGSYQRGKVRQLVAPASGFSLSAICHLSSVICHLSCVSPVMRFAS
jgi:hypothetical protein